MRPSAETWGPPGWVRRTVDHVHSHMMKGTQVKNTNTMHLNKFQRKMPFIYVIVFWLFEHEDQLVGKGHAVIDQR